MSKPSRLLVSSSHLIRTHVLAKSVALASTCVLVACTPSSTSTSNPVSKVNEVTPDNRPESVARMWNDVLLDAIRKDRARPPIHARNLFHISAAMYDAWAAYDDKAGTYLLGKTLNGYQCIDPTKISYTDTQIARETALSFAVYKLILNRFVQSPGYDATKSAADSLMRQLGYTPSTTASTIGLSSAADLGIKIADCYIAYGLRDGSNEMGSHANQFYTPSNPALDPTKAGNPSIKNLDTWQPLLLGNFIDQSGNVIKGGSASFIGAEWGNVKPFSLSANQSTLYQRNNVNYPVYLDPGMPASIYGARAEEYQWSFALVAKWSSHLSTKDGVKIDISPASMGNNDPLVTQNSSFNAQLAFYNERDGGDYSKGYRSNPVTGQPYTPQIVPRGDYTRVLAEFWADGPNSETPPGHWFLIHNNVVKHPSFKKRFRGVGAELGSLEWDVKAYFALGGAMHDTAVAVWSIKGWYDGIRPISAIRAMADLGQSTRSDLPHYHPQGLKLDPGFIELIYAGDPLAGANGQHIGKIKLKAWHFPTAELPLSGVDWIRAEEWWPYQRPTFVTPPFAGYVSGHSGYSRAAAEVLTAMTGSPYFPDGLGRFPVQRFDFNSVELAPDAPLTLQWASYRDAADQSALSRIWGGIHPPMDDLAARAIGAKIGVSATNFAEKYFNSK